MNNKKDKIEETYLDVINESYHSPLRGGSLFWTANAFEKIIKDVELGPALKTKGGLKGVFASNNLLKEIDHTLINKKIYSFKKLLMQDPEITTAGQRKKF